VPPSLSESVDVVRAAVSEEPEMVAALDHLLGWEKREGRGAVWDSFWSAWDAFAGAENYRETVERAIAYGNDTDTTAAIAGGLAGVYWGVDGIPQEWLNAMRGRDVVVPLVDALLAKAGWKTSTGRPLRVDWVAADDVPEYGGRLGMTFLDRQAGDGWTGKHWRDLETDAKRLAEAHRADTYLLLVEDHELEAARVTRIGEVLPAHGVDLVRFPIRDMDVTSDDAGLRNVLDEMRRRLTQGKRVVVACRGGLGRPARSLPVSSAMPDSTLTKRYELRARPDTTRSNGHPRSSSSERGCLRDAQGRCRGATRGRPLAGRPAR
jgi:hypothetical protein